MHPSRPQWGPERDIARGHVRGNTSQKPPGRGSHASEKVRPEGSLPSENRQFDIVYCCDVLEHVRDVTRVIGEIARVLTPGGIYFYDTINRTLWSNLLMIKFLQDWEWSRLLPC